MFPQLRLRTAKLCFGEGGPNAEVLIYHHFPDLFLVRRVLSGLDSLQRDLGMVIFGCRETFQPFLSRLRHLGLNIPESAGESLCRKAFRCLAFRLVLLRGFSKRFNLGFSCRCQRIFGGKRFSTNFLRANSCKSARVDGFLRFSEPN
jgi:hypothetical protein